MQVLVFGEKKQFQRLPKTDGLPNPGLLPTGRALLSLTSWPPRFCTSMGLGVWDGDPRDLRWKSTGKEVFWYVRFVGFRVGLMFEGEDLFQFLETEAERLSMPTKGQKMSGFEIRKQPGFPRGILLDTFWKKWYVWKLCYKILWRFQKATWSTKTCKKACHLQKASDPSWEADSGTGPSRPDNGSRSCGSRTVEDSLTPQRTN